MSSAQGYKPSGAAAEVGNQSGAKGAAIGQTQQSTTSEDVGSLPADFTLSNTAHESKGEDKTVPIDAGNTRDPTRDGDTNPLQTAGPGGPGADTMKTKGEPRVDLPPRSNEQGPHRVADPKNQGAGVF